MDPEAATLGPDVETRKGHDGLRNYVLRQTEQDPGSLGEERAGVSNRAFELGRDSIKLRA
jgi:hypothetical protein